MLNILPAVQDRYRWALSIIKDGADVTDQALASALKQMDQDHPGLVWLCKPLGEFPDPAKVEFGAIATPRGLQFLRESGGEA